MKRLLYIQLLFLFGCASKETFQTQFPIPIVDYFYEVKGNKTFFLIEFQQPIPNKIKLEKFYFRNQTAKIKMISSQKAEAVFVKPDLIFDSNPEKEYGNEPPTIQKSQFNLKPTEAVLEFKQVGKVKHYKFRDVVERATN